MEKSLLKLATVGSVDDGKSTLIGRLLYETNCIYEDQYESVKRISQKKGNAEVDLSLFLDGLSAEREQGITIDVAYKYFSTDKRKFIIADCPGHEQYTRNMITGASNVDLAIILIDARNGVMTQSKRHGFLVSLLGISHLVVAVNKMDLVDYSQEIYNKIVEEYTEFTKKINIPNVIFIPISAFKGDNIISLSSKTSWYKGTPLLYLLENVQVNSNKNTIDFRFPVQNVIRPNLDFRGFAGTVISGAVHKGDVIMALPSMAESKVKSIEAFKQTLDKAETGQSVVLTLENEIDISHGDMIVKKQNVPAISNQFEATICCLDQEIMPNKSYILKQTSHSVNAYVTDIQYKINVNNIHQEETKLLKLNEIGKVKIKTTRPIYFDPYQINKMTGSFILIDPYTNLTIAAGMIKKSYQDTEKKSTNISKEDNVITREQWEGKNHHEAKVIWLTGLSGSGKSTLAKRLVEDYFNQGKHVVMLDGDNLRNGLCSNLGFSDEDRKENIRRVGEVAKLFYNQGNFVICSLISPFQKDRDMVKNMFPEDDFYEIYVRCSLESCKKRDPKGLYKKNISNFTGIASLYEEPQNADLMVDTDNLSIEESISLIKSFL
jgi:bifunctional enzyme CysN/CysC